MPISFIVVPQWQGSASTRAMRVADGALAISGDLPGSVTTTVEIPGEAGDSLGCGVARCSSIMTARDRVSDALARTSSPAIVIGGDCGTELAAVAHADADDVTLVWFDAHPDLNTPESSPSGAFTGMVLRTLLGDGPDTLVPARAVSPARVVLVGTRALDQAEADYISATGIRSLPADCSAEDLMDAVAATGARRVYVHVDVDVLDPAEIASAGTPVPFGMTAASLAEGIRALLAKFELAGAGITQFSPASTAAAEDDLAVILRIISALTSGNSTSGNTTSGNSTSAD